MTRDEAIKLLTNRRDGNREMGASYQKLLMLLLPEDPSTDSYAKSGKAHENYAAALDLAIAALQAQPGLVEAIGRLMQRIDCELHGYSGATREAMEFALVNLSKLEEKPNAV